MKILAIFVVGCLLVFGKFVEADEEMLVVKKLKLGRKAAARAAYEVVQGNNNNNNNNNKINVEGNNRAEKIVDNNDDDSNENEDSSGADSHRLFPEEGKPKFVNPPRTRHMP
ncbi:hypothetical protein ACP275_07G004100 [Erythranthe tilingii]